MKVLWVDDDAALMRGLERFLTDRGASVDLALDVDTALHRIATESYDLALIDLLLPRRAWRKVPVSEEPPASPMEGSFGGLTIARAIRAKERDHRSGRKTTIVFLSILNESEIGPDLTLLDAQFINKIDLVTGGLSRIGDLVTG